MFNLGTTILRYDKLTLIDIFKSRLKFTNYNTFYQVNLTFNLYVKVENLIINCQDWLMYIKGRLASLIPLSQKPNLYIIDLIKT